MLPEFVILFVCGVMYVTGCCLDPYEDEETEV